MSREIFKAGDISVPREVIVRPQCGNIFRTVLMIRKLDEQEVGYHFYAIGIDPTTNKRISLAPNTLVELATPVVK